MAELVLLATAWGPKHGGINAFNMDFAKALGRLLGSGRVVCVVLEASAEETQDAAQANVTLLAVGKSRDHDRFEESRAYDVRDLLENHGIRPGANTAWIGHDIHTGEVALRMVKIGQPGVAVAIQHMSFRDYISYRDGIGEKAKQKHERPQALFQAADCVFAVGPLLRNRLSEIVAEQGKTPHMIIPGLADITPSATPAPVFRAVTLGRLGPADDRIKQGRLAVAALASACRAACEDSRLPSALCDVEMLLYGIEEAGGEEESALRELAQEKADRVINLIPLTFSSNRQDLFQELRRCSVAMMLSWHEGFGLTGWEAIAAGVPLIASRKSGLYELIHAALGDAGLALLKAVEIKGRDDKTGDANFHPDDEKTVREALLMLAKDPGKAKQNALDLRQRLLEKNFTWTHAARKFVDDLRVCDAFARRGDKPLWDIATQGPPYRGLQAMTDQHAAVFFGRGPQLRQLKEKLDGQRFVAVVGASGAGKSSLVWAGLLPKLEAWQVGGISRWAWVRMTPAEIAKHTPLEILADVLAEKFKLRFSRCEQALQAGRTELQALLKEIHPKSDPAWQLLLFIDQFEELFSRQVEDHARQPFIDALDGLMASGLVRVVATMRAEFLGQCMDCEAFGERLADWFNGGQLLLAAPNESALREMVEGPARLAGLSFDPPGLVDTIIEDTGLKPGNLALMAFALERLYGQREGQVMARQAYDAFGGVEGAIADKAEEVYKACPGGRGLGGGDPLAEVFRELVEIDENSGAATRRRAALALWGLGPDGRGLKPAPTAAQRLIQDFIQARLLLTDGEAGKTLTQPSPAGRGLDRFPKKAAAPTLEVAHEALFRNWPLLRDWIAGRKDQFLMRKRLQRDAAEWERRGKPDALRWLDPLAVEAGAMIRALPYTPTDWEADFLGPVLREDMLRRIHLAETAHEVRATIGVRLALIGDDRPGVGVKDGLPDIVWCPVPPGKVELEDGAGVFDVEACQISKYPVTQAQYRLFVEAEDGYAKPDWWQGLPKRYYPDPGRQIPAFGNHQAVNVDWMEAMAYCRWLSHKLGKTVRLPTEWEWQQAACGGDPANRYPWGPDWDGRRANTYESQLNRTVAVGLHAQDWSEDRPLDMAGNVWEWCLNEYAKPVPVADIVWQDYAERTVRGGSWNYKAGFARCAYRYRNLPDDRDDNLGLRLCCVLPGAF